MDENRTSRDLIMKLACMISYVLKRWKLIVLIALIGAMGFDTVRTLMYHPRYQASVSATLGSEQKHLFAAGYDTGVYPLAFLYF